MKLNGHFGFKRANSLAQDLDLIRVLASRQLKIRYRKSTFGALWTLLNPILITGVLWFVFVNVFASRFTLSISYASYVFSGIIFLNLIQGTIPMIGDTITSSGALPSKVPVRPSLFVYATALSGIINFMVGLLPLVIISMIFDNGVTVKFFYIIPWIVMVFLCISSIGILVALLFSNFDDTRNIVAILLMLLTYVTPIFYPLEMLNGVAFKIVQMNPFTTGINTFRESVLGYGHTDMSQIIIATLVILSLFAISKSLLNRFWPEMVTRV